MQSYLIIADISKPFMENYIFFYQVVIKESLESEVLLPDIKKKKGGTCMSESKAHGRLQSNPRKTILGNERQPYYFILLVSSLLPVLRMPKRMPFTIASF